MPGNWGALFPDREVDKAASVEELRGLLRALWPIFSTLSVL